MIDPVDDVTRPLPVATESPIRLQFAAPDERIHTVVLMQDLFQQWVILQTWGGKHNTSGGSKPQPFDSLDAGLAALTAIARRHEKRGYVPVGTASA